MVNGADPLVSVVIPAHNARCTLRRALRSVVAQTCSPFEVIVVDDASTDGTGDVARDFREFPVRLETLPQQKGPAAARNRGIAVSRGDYVAFLDADDEWLPEKTALQVELLRDNPGLAFVTCESDLIAPDGRPVGIVNPNRAKPHGAEAWKVFLHHPCIATPSVMARRDLLQDVGGFNPELPIGEDQDLWIRLALRGPVHHIARSLARVHEQPNSLSRAQRGRATSVTLPMIIAHVNAQRDRLTRAEADDILGTRYSEIGRAAYLAGNIREGSSLLAAAIWRGHRPWANLAYLVSASPPVRLAKRMVRHRALMPEGLQSRSPVL